MMPASTSTHSHSDDVPSNPLSTIPHAQSKSRVAYFYRPETANFYYGPGHPMKPQRLRLTHHLLLATGVLHKLKVMHPHAASSGEMEHFHLPDYVQFIKRISPATEQEFEKQALRFAMGRECDSPIFTGLFDFMSVCAGASIDAAMQINHGQADVCVNWAGGLHHAKKAEASGFCYINDIVLCILELLKYHARVLYVDIDIHHGDGVEEAFYTTDRVMTCSFHQGGDFFPGTGAVEDTGHGAGAGCSVNFPLFRGLDDAGFTQVFKPVLAKIMQVYQPSAVVMCCGADSIVGDRLGVWNLSLHGHAMAVDYVKSFGLPVVLLGGGGYTPRNVARCWAYETAVALGQHGELRDEIPPNDFLPAYGPNPRLHVDVDPFMENCNSRQYLEQTTNTILENLSRLKGAPSVQFQEVPPDFLPSDAQRQEPSGMAGFLNPSEGALNDE